MIITYIWVTQELPTPPKHLGSLPVIDGVIVARLFTFLCYVVVCLSSSYVYSNVAIGYQYIYLIVYIKTITESILWLTQCRQQAQSIHNYTVSSGTLVSLWNICVTNDDGYVPLVVIRMSPFPHYLLIVGFLTRVTRRVWLVEH